MDREKLEKYKNLLLDEKKEILDELLNDNEDYLDLDHEEIGDLVDQAYKSYEKELLIGLSTNEKNTLELIEKALKKIEEGNYGKCDTCGGVIDERRLEAIPYAENCISCKSQQKKHKAKYNISTNDFDASSYQ